jgi:homoserine kinase type II
VLRGRQIVQLDQGPRLRSYEEVRPLSAAERQAMPMLARGAALRFLLTRAYDWLNTPKDALVSPKNPAEYVRRLRFHQSVRSIADYGLGEGAQ